MKIIIDTTQQNVFSLKHQLLAVNHYITKNTKPDGTIEPTNNNIPCIVLPMRDGVGVHLQCRILKNSIFFNTWPTHLPIPNL